MKTFRFEFDTLLRFEEAIGNQAFLLRCTPADDCIQKVLGFSVRVFPETSLFVQKDAFGNSTFIGREIKAHKLFRYRTVGKVRTDSAGRTPVMYEEMMLYSGTGLMTRKNAMLNSFAESIRPLFKGMDLERKALLLNSCVGNRIEYAPGVTSVNTTAAEAFQGGKGVCQDFANIYIAVAKILGLRVRYCMGLASAEGATHAWVEVLFPDGWHGFDPTRGCRTDETYIRFASGRDSYDCPVERGVFTGKCRQIQQVRTAIAEC